MEVAPPHPVSDTPTSDVRITHAPTIVTPRGATITTAPAIVGSEKETNKQLDHAALELPDSLIPSGNFQTNFGEAVFYSFNFFCQ